MATAKRKAGGKANGGNNCTSNCRRGWSSGWKSSAVCWPWCALNWRPPPPAWTPPAPPALEAAAPAVRPKGLGGLTYEVVQREVGDWNRFDNRRQVGSYTGLCGGVSSSGNSYRLLPITKHGNVRLRTALI